MEKKKSIQNKGQLLFLCCISFQTITDCNYWFKKSKCIEYDQYEVMESHIRNNLEHCSKGRMDVSVCVENNISLVKKKVRNRYGSLFRC